MGRGAGETPACIVDKKRERGELEVTWEEFESSCVFLTAFFFSFLTCTRRSDLRG